MDPLSQVIALMKPQGLAWRLIDLPQGGGIRFPQSEVVVFGQ